MTETLISFPLRRMARRCQGVTTQLISEPTQDSNMTSTEGYTATLLMTSFSKLKISRLGYHSIIMVTVHCPRTIHPQVRRVSSMTAEVSMPPRLTEPNLPAHRTFSPLAVGSQPILQMHRIQVLISSRAKAQSHSRWLEQEILRHNTTRMAPRLTALLILLPQKLTILAFNKSSLIQ